MNKILNKETFNEIIKDVNCPGILSIDYLYEIYSAVIEGIYSIMSSAPNYRFIPVNHVNVILYILNEVNYSIRTMNKEEITTLENDEKFNSLLASVCCDKYLTNDQLNYKSQIYLNKFNPEISTMSLYLNFTLNTIEKIQVNDQISKLVKRMLFKAFSLGKCIVQLLLNGFETEAFSTWRTLHENESIITCLLKNGEPMFNSYFRHMTYALAYRHQMSQEEQDQIFLEIKAKMKTYDLKSKDMKKFIEYGYLYEIKDFNQLGLKLNFRDGVEKAAGLEKYSKTYEMSSEIAHSSPLLLLSNDSYLLYLTLLNLYETFFRLEKMFYSYFKAFSNDDSAKQYEAMRNLYLNQLMVIYNNVINEFKNSNLKNEIKKEFKHDA